MRKDSSNNSALADAAFKQGRGLHHAGNLAGAELSYRQAVSLSPDHWEAYHFLGLVSHQTRRHDVAIELIHKAIELHGKSPHMLNNHNVAEMLNNLGMAQFSAGQFADAASSYRRALALKPDLTNAHMNLGNALIRMGDTAAALESVRRAVSIKPDSLVARFALAHILRAQCHLDDAASIYREILATHPNLAEAHNNLGNVLQTQGRYLEAVECLSRSLAINPNSATTHSNLAGAYAALGRVDDAIERYRDALRLAPDNATLHSNLLLTLNYSIRYSARALFDEHLQYGRHHADRVPRLPRSTAPTGKPDQRLKIGYVSADFRDHVLNYFIEPVLESHDTSRFEVFCYSSNIAVDTVTRRLQGYVPNWRSIATASDDAAAQMIREDGIDILVDLAGHTAGNRLLVFARKPVAVQVTWLGYLNTTGVASINYRVTDARADPPGIADELHTEKLYRLPGSLWCYRPPAASPAVNDLPALERGYVTFGAFHNQAKLSGQAAALWASVLRAVPESRLVIAVSGSHDDVREMFVQTGIAGDRIEIVSRMPLADYLQLLRRVDIGLDSHPYSGGATTLHSLWMGVPVLTLCGETSVSRSSTSIEATLGLDDFIAHTPEELPTRAIRVTRNLQRLATLRGMLREIMAQTTLVDAAQFTRNLERAYVEMYSSAG